MLKKIELRLTFFCTLIIGLILFIMTSFCLYISANSLRAKDRSDFQANTESILSTLNSQTLLSHAWLASMEHNYNLIIDICDGDTPILYHRLRASDAYTALLKKARETALSQYHLGPDSVSSRIRIQQEIFSLADAGGSRYLVSAAILFRGGSYLDVVILHPESLVETQIRNQAFLFGGSALAAWILLSILARIFVHRLLRPIEENHRRQTQFVASASHELRSPLTVILSSLSAAEMAEAKEQRRFLEAARIEGQRMSRLISDMLTLANSDNQNWSIAPSSIELDTLLLQTYEKYEPLAHSKNLALQVRLPEDPLPPCRCDPDRISQLLSILIDNALCYTPSGGLVQLSLAYTGSVFEFSVSDNGPGIPDKEKAHIFERFYRADVSHKDREHFGLGLCVAKEIARLHQGNISIKDTPGGGASFTVTLPVK